jgi:hypothetical protein
MEKGKMRKVIQVAITNHVHDEDPIIIALCDDGSMWSNYIESDGSLDQWIKVTPIPQPDDTSEDGDWI